MALRTNAGPGKTRSGKQGADNAGPSLEAETDLIPPPLDQTPVLEHRLEGLAPDNLLAILALLGLMRCLDVARPDWHARVRWAVGSDPDALCPTRPVLVLPSARSQADIVTAALEGADALALGYDFNDESNINFSLPKARAYLTAAIDQPHGRPALFAALFSDGAFDAKKEVLEATPYCFQFGQGHQHMLKFLSRNARTGAPAERGSGRRKIQPSAADALSEALFHAWARLDSGAHHSSFRWDPAEDVRYAYRLDDPSKAGTKEGTMHGANRLAALGLAEMTAVPVQRGPRVRLAALGMVRHDGQVRFRWPVWRAPASLATIRALLGHPLVLQPAGLGDDQRPASREQGEHRAVARRQLRALSVAEVWEAQRISVGKFMNVTRADPVLLLGREE